MPIATLSRALVLVPLALGACATQQYPYPLPQTSAQSVTYQPYGPAVAPGGAVSGYASDGSIVFQPDPGPFGTSDPISVTDGGPFPDNDLALDSSLDDLSAEDRALIDGTDIGAERLAMQSLDVPASDGAMAEAGIGTVVYFDTDSSELDESARETLRSQAAWLELNLDARATLAGHADERGTREYNLALGERRASAVRSYMTALGVDGRRLRKVSFGKEQPAVPGSGPAAWSQNRRVETITGAGDGAATGTARRSARAPDTPEDSPSLGALPPLPEAGDDYDPLLDPELDALLGTGGDPLSEDIPDNPVLERLGGGS